EAMTAPNAVITRSFRRRKICSVRITSDSSFVDESGSWGIDNLSGHDVIDLRHDDDVARPHEEVFLLGSVGNLAVIEGDASCRSAGLPEHDDAIARGEIGEPLCHRNHFQYGR